MEVIEEEKESERRTSRYGAVTLPVQTLQSSTSGHGGLFPALARFNLVEAQSLLLEW